MRFGSSLADDEDDDEEVLGPHPEWRRSYILINTSPL